MGTARRKRRIQERLSQKHFNVFGSLLMGFYEFLEQVPKPSGEAVREEFIEREQQWLRYCRANHFAEAAFLLFNKEVSASWEKRYRKKTEGEPAT